MRFSAFAFCGLTSRPYRAAFGSSSRSSPRCFATRSLNRKLTPVALPPGRERLATRPSSTGSSATLITLLGGAAVGWPFGVRAQQRMRRIGVLMGLAEVIRKVVLALRHWPGLYRIWAGLKDTISERTIAGPLATSNAPTSSRRSWCVQHPMRSSSTPRPACQHCKARPTRYQSFLYKSSMLPRAPS